MGTDIEEIERGIQFIHDYANPPEADETRVGSGGVSLGGGQRQGVVSVLVCDSRWLILNLKACSYSLRPPARTVYSRKAVVIVDDCFSGLKNRTAVDIFDNLSGQCGLLREESITVIVATHSSRMLN